MAACDCALASSRSQAIRRRGNASTSRDLRRLAAGSTVTAIGPSGNAPRIWSISARLCSTSRMRIQTRALTSPAVEDRHGEFELVVGRVARRLARIETAAAGAADIAAGAELPREFGRHDAGRHGAVLQRGGVVVEFDQARKFDRDVPQALANDIGAAGSQDRRRRRPARPGPSSADGRNRPRPRAGFARAQCRTGHA